MAHRGIDCFAFGLSIRHHIKKRAAEQHQNFALLTLLDAMDMEIQLVTLPAFHFYFPAASHG
jgi:hypothetical protein